MLLDEFGGAASAVIDGSADDVFSLITNIDRLPEWNARIRRVLKPPVRPFVPGTEWVVQMQVAGGRWASRSAMVSHDASRRVFEYTSRTDDGNPSRARWRWQVTPISHQRSQIEVTWRGTPRTFWRRALFARLRRRQLRDEVPTSLTALAALLARQSATAAA